MKLTLRQKAFLSQVLDLYTETRQPIHYGAVAEKLGVGNTTAYDMMKLLERKGYVVSEYVLAEDRAGPGRSSVVFHPTAKAREEFQRLAGDAAEDTEWWRVKTRILRNLEDGQFSDRELLAELLAAIPQSDSPLVYSGQVITALILIIHDRMQQLRQHALLRTLLSSPLPRDPKLLSGLVLGLFLSETANLQTSLVSTLTEYVRKYQEYLREMDDEAQASLQDYLQKVVAYLQI